MSKPSPSLLQSARRVALACLFWAIAAGNARGNGLYDVVDLGQDRGTNYVFNASGALTTQATGVPVRAQSGIFSIANHPDPAEGFSLRGYVTAQGQSPIELDTVFNNAYGSIYASAVNLSGMVVGTEFASTLGPGVPFEYVQGRSMAVLAMPLATANVVGTASSINDLGAVVGTYAVDPTSTYLAYLTVGGTSIDLTSEISPTLGIILNGGIDINDAGQIIARGTNAQSQVHDYLLTPNAGTVPEPASILLVGSATLILAARRLARRRPPRDQAWSGGAIGATRPSASAS